MNFLPVLKSMLMASEGFSAVPIWDHKQWSIGFGTWIGTDRTKKPAVTWTKERAWIEAEKIVVTHYNKLSKALKVSLNANQWAALLSFSYNLGVETGLKMVGYINSGNPSLVSSKWILYVIASGKREPGLVRRRNEELKLYNTAKGISNPAAGGSGSVNFTSKEKITVIIALVILLYLFL